MQGFMSLVVAGETEASGSIRPAGQGGALFATMRVNENGKALEFNGDFKKPAMTIRVASGSMKWLMPLPPTAVGAGREDQLTAAGSEVLRGY